MRKRVLIILSFILTLSVFFVFTAAAEEASSLPAEEPSSTADPVVDEFCLCGDVNGDGKILANDARTILRFSARLEEPENDQQLRMSDLDHDDVVLAKDARTALRISASLEPRVAHALSDAPTCTEPQFCETCGIVVRYALGHRWAAATCTEPKTCSRCGETEGEALGHDWMDATYTAPKTCSVCGTTEGEPIPVDEDEYIMSIAMSELRIGYSEGDYENSVTGKLELPDSVSVVKQANETADVSISWSSSDEAVVLNDGEVIRPDGENKEIELTATLSYNEKTAEKTFMITVISQLDLTEEDLQAQTIHDIELLNADSDYELDIDYCENGEAVEFISGSFSNIPVNSIDSAIASLETVKNLIGIPNVEDNLQWMVTNHDIATLSYSFGQVYHEIPVYGRTVTVSADFETGETTSLASSVLPSSVFAELSFDNLMTPDELAQLIDDETEEYTLVIYSLDAYNDNPILAYVVTSPTTEYIVDAHSGAIITKAEVEDTVQNLLDYVAFSVRGHGPTELNDEDVEFPVSYNLLSKMFSMKDIQRKIYIKDAGNNGSYYESALNTGWNDRSAISAYTNTITVYDWYKNVLGRKSIDNRGMDVVVNVNSTEKVNNASWNNKHNYITFYKNGQKTTDEDGNTILIPNDSLPTYAACLDVVAHEYTHGVFKNCIGGWYSSGLIRAINEGYADTFGWFVDPDNTTHAESRRTNRDIADPDVGSHPRTIDNIDPTADEHTNMSLVSYAAYLMHNAGLKINTSSHKLEKLWYNSMSVGYDGTSDFYTVRRNVIQAAKNLRFSDEELRIIRKAFDDEHIYDEKSAIKIVFKDIDGNVVSPNTLSDNNLLGYTISRQNADVPAQPLAGEFRDDCIYMKEVYFGKFDLEVTADGYQTFTSVVNVAGQDHEHFDAYPTVVTVTLIEDGIGAVHGNVVNAITGQLEPEVAITVYEGFNAVPGTSTLINATTSGTNGTYRIEGLKAGFYTVLLNKEEFNTNSYNLIVYANQDKEYSLSISPEIELEGNSYRVVLTWGANPSDLDSHLFGYRIDDTGHDNQQYRIYFSNKNAYDNSVLIANLDIDDTTSYGPETTTFLIQPNHKYVFYVDWYSGSGTWASSGGRVDVYNGDYKIATYNVPEVNNQSGSWKVFTINNGIYTGNNTIVDDDIY